MNSLGLGDPPSVERIARRVEANPTVGFKLDADISWTAEIVRELAGLDCVRTVDFKGRYGFEVEDVDALVAMYRAVLDAFPAALLEDPHDLPEIDAVLEPVRDRVSFDAPIARVSDITTRTINVKPSRIGGLRPLFEIYEHCAQHGIAMYGGGMGELGIARGQIELLASLFHPDARQRRRAVGVQRPRARPTGCRRARSSRPRSSRPASAGADGSGGVGQVRVGAPGARLRARRPVISSSSACAAASSSVSRSPRQLAELGKRASVRARAGADPQVLGDRAAQAQLGLVGAAERVREPCEEVLRPSRCRCRRGRRPGTAARSARASRRASSAASRSPSRVAASARYAEHVPVEAGGQLRRRRRPSARAAPARAGPGRPGPRRSGRPRPASDHGSAEAAACSTKLVAVESSAGARGPRARSRAGRAPATAPSGRRPRPASASASRPSASASAQRPSSCASVERQSGTYQR